MLDDSKLGTNLSMPDDYLTVVASDAPILDDRVNGKIQEGYRPIGGVAVTCYERRDRTGSMQVEFWYAQAMVKP